MHLFPLLTLLWTLAHGASSHEHALDLETSLNAIHGDLRVRGFENYPYRDRLLTYAYVEIDPTSDPVKIIVHDHRDVERMAIILRGLHFLNATVYFRSAIFDGDDYICRANLAYSFSFGVIAAMNNQSADILRSSPLLNLLGICPISVFSSEVLSQDESYTDSWRTIRWTRSGR